MDLQSIYTDQAPKAGGHYSQAIVYNGLVYVSGQLPVDREGIKHTDKSVEEQTKLVFNNIRSILAAANSSIERVIQVTIYVSTVEFWGNVNEVYAEVFGDHKPARAVVPVKELHFDAALEVQLIAAVNQ